MSCFTVDLYLFKYILAKRDTWYHFYNIVVYDKKKHLEKLLIRLNAIKINDSIDFFLSIIKAII
jgi:hypothetical protein